MPRGCPHIEAWVLYLADDPGPSHPGVAGLWELDMAVDQQHLHLQGACEKRGLSHLIPPIQSEAAFKEGPQEIRVLLSFEGKLLTTLRSYPKIQH